MAQFVALELSNESDHPSEVAEAPRVQSPGLDAKLIPQSSKQLNVFMEQTKVLDRYFSVAETAIAELQGATDQRDMTSMNEMEKREEKQLDKKRKSALQAGQSALNAVNDTLKQLKQQLDQRRVLEENIWKTNDRLYGTYSTDYRVMSELVQQQSKRFVATCHSFSDASLGTKASLEKKVKRIFRYIDASKTDEELDAMVQAEGTDKLASLILNTKSQADEILQNAQEKRELCQNINRTAQEIKQMTLDFAALIEQQSEQIDRIEMHVKEARADVQAGITNLQKANKHAKTSKKCMCCGLCIAAVVGVVVLLIIMGVLRK